MNPFQVKFAVLWAYIKAMGVGGAFLSIACIVVFQSLNVFGNFFLTFWTEDDILKNQNLSGTQEYEDRNSYYLGIYGLLGVVQGKQ